MKTKTIRPRLLEKGDHVLFLGTDLEMSPRRVKHISKISDRGRVRAYRVTFDDDGTEIYPTTSKVEVVDFEPAAQDHRTCYSIMLFDDERVADLYAETVRAAGRTYNGGFQHGRLCGRDTSWDRTDEQTGTRLYAVTC